MVWWVAVVVVVGAILMTVGGVLALVRPAMLVGAGVEVGSAPRVFAGYFAARNLAIGGFLVGALLLRRRGALMTLLLLACAVQGADVVFDVVEGRWPIVPGVLVLGILFGWAAMRLRRESGITQMASHS